MIDTTSPLDPRPKTIVVALDGSPVAEEALPVALAHARAFGAELLLLRVVPPALLSLHAAGRPSPPRDEPENEDEQAALAYLEALAENLRSDSVAVGCRVRRGPIAATIIEEAGHADMLLLANHGAGRLARFVTGSIAAQVLPLIPCPTLLVPVTPPKPGPDAAVRNFADDAERYGPLMQRPLGVRTVAVERVVGSVGRATELRADFMPRARPGGDFRFKRIKAALEDAKVMPPVDLYKLGYYYYVLDGHHRVAAARATGQLEIDAVVTEFLAVSNSEVHQVFVERRRFERETELTRVGATRPGHYQALRDMIDRYAQREGLGDLGAAAAAWYASVYVPMAHRLRVARLGTTFPGERTADLVVHVEELRAQEEARLGRPVSWEEALQLLVTRYRSSRRYARRRLPNLRTLLDRI